jgi:ribose 5-phosphate isomerase B
MRVAVGNDHAGFSLKPHVVEYVRRLGHEVVDVGTVDDTPVDFPVMTRRVTDLVTGAEADRGILVCGTGVGAAIAANKVPGIRSAVIHDTYVARQGWNTTTSTWPVSAHGWSASASPRTSSRRS